MTDFKTLTATIISEMTTVLELDDPSQVSDDLVHHTAEWMTKVCQAKTQVIMEKLKNE